ncbi:alpha/beta hydrolase fold domain-containing protein [Tundrisphaera lichenicola]|uniref:alpha/beta hydrolase fold domain-containing protein n=1 Tax=Tundrisphaera lichenicola TaxID=2029860 RepID=UPI003EC12831
MRIRAKLGVLALTLFAWVAAPSSADDPRVATAYDLTYCRAGDVDLKLDLAYPVEGTGPFPAVVVFYGGAWRTGNKWGNRPTLKEFARRGFVAISPQYRHCPKYIFPAQIHDAKAAVRWLRTHAEEYRIDPDHIGAMGFSAGAHLSLMLGLTGPEDGLEGDVAPDSPSSKVQAVVNYFAPTDLNAPAVTKFAKGLIRDFLGVLPTERPEVAAKASPVTYVTGDDAAILTFHGTKDPLVPFDQANRLASAMTRAGLEGRTELITDAGHGWYGPEMKKTMEETYAFFEEHLRPAKH